MTFRKFTNKGTSNHINPDSSAKHSVVFKQVNALPITETLVLIVKPSLYKV